MVRAGNSWVRLGNAGIIWEILGILSLMIIESITSAKDLKLWEKLGTVGNIREILGVFGGDWSALGKIGESRFLSL